MANEELAGIFFEMADILEMKNVQWKPRAYRQAARAIGSSEDVSILYKKGGKKTLEEIPGVGEGIAKKIVEFIKTGKIRAYESLRKKVPSHINVLVKIPGMGLKKVKKLNKLLKISTVNQLEKACKQHKIAKIEGFGTKSELDILEGIVMMRLSKGRLPLKKAQVIANRIVKELKKLREVKQISTAGSLKRKKMTVRDIDILVASEKPYKVITVFTKIKDVKKVLMKGPTKATIILKSGVQIDLRVLSAKSWGAGLLYFIGSKNYNIELRKIAMKKGFKLNEYGLFDEQTGKMIAGRTEKDVLKKLGVKYLKPEEREK